MHLDIPTILVWFCPITKILKEKPINYKNELDHITFCSQKSLAFPSICRPSAVFLSSYKAIYEHIHVLNGFIEHVVSFFNVIGLAFR